MKNKLLPLVLLVFLALAWQTSSAQTVTSSMSPYTFDGNWALSNVVDNDYSTSFWANAAQEPGDYVQVDYGSLTTVCSISMYFQRNTSGALWDAPTGTAKIQISEDALRWTDIATFTANDIGGAETNNVYSCNAGGAVARYVRLYLVSANGDSWLRITEIEAETDCVVAERTINVETSNAAMGTAYIGTEGTTSVTSSEIVTVTAVAAENYVFVNWTNKATGEEVSTESVYRYGLSEDITLVANFKWDSTVSRDGWTAYADSYYDGTSASDGPASWAIDGKNETWWHSQYNQTVTTYPHWIMFDLGKSQSFTSFNYVSRNGMISDSGNGNIASYELYVSDNEADVKNYLESAKVAEGKFEYDGTTREGVDHIVEIPGGAKGRYVLLKGLTSANGEAFAACAEFYIYLEAYQVSVVSSDKTKGYVYIGEEGTTSTSVSLDGTETVTLTAVALEGYEFAGWYKNGALVSTDAIYTTEAITESVIYTAEFNFIPVPERTVTVASSDALKGSVRIVEPATDELTVSSTGIVTVEATPLSSDHAFINWTDESGEVVSTDAVYNYAKEGDVVLTANFVSYYTVTINTVSGGNIIVSSEAGRVSSGDRILGGTSLNVMLDPDRTMEPTSLQINGNEVFGEYSETDGYSFKISASTTISATFGTANYSIVYEYTGSGYVEVWSSDTYDGDAESEGTLELPLLPAGEKYNMYDKVPYASMVYIFLVEQGGELQSVLINGSEYVDDENFLLYGDIEYTVDTDLNIVATFSGNDLTGVEENAASGSAVDVYGVNGGINIVSSESTEVKVYSAAGVLTRAAEVDGTSFIPLQSGFYLVQAGGETFKVVVK